MYFAVQALTFGDPRPRGEHLVPGLSAPRRRVGRDRFFPRQFVNLGDRLVYSNGIIVLAGIASLLIWVFHANVISLIHLYVIGVFTAFTLSQAGMVRHWPRRKRARLAPARRDQRVRRARDRCRDRARDPGEVPRGRVDGDVAIPVLIALFSSSTATTAPSPGACAPGTPRVAAPPPRTGSSSTSSGSTPATSPALWYARADRGHEFHAV